MEERFLKHINKTDGCWEWTASINHSKYGLFWLDGKYHKAHRIAYELWNGVIPDGLLVRHKCDNRKCVNPQHLETGTHQDNSNDAVERNRQAKGEQLSSLRRGEKHWSTKHPEKVASRERHGKSKLKEDDIVEIRVLAVFFTQLELADIYKVSRRNINRILNNKLWKVIINE